MSKLAPTTIKYQIKANITATGVVEKPDVIGAIFGQTEGLLGSELNLRELQRTGKIGRIEVKIKSENGKSDGTIIIPSALNSSETALIAATLETIDRIGPCTAAVKLEKVEDLRRGFAIAKKVGIKTFASFIVGNPGEGLAEIEETKKFALEVKPNMAGFYILVPYPGAALYESAKNNNWFTPAGKEFSKNWSNKQSETPIMAINLPPEVLLKKRMELENLFVWRNHKIIIFGFFKNPKYFWQMLVSLFKNFKSNWRTLRESFRTGKARLFVEECYQNFSYDLKVKLAKQYKNS